MLDELYELLEKLEINSHYYVLFRLQTYRYVSLSVLINVGID